jgi:hypothetical protein
MSEQLERLLAQYAGVDVVLGSEPRTQAAYLEEVFLANLRAMHSRQNKRFEVMIGVVAAMFTLVFLFSLTNHFSLDIAKIAIGSGGVVSVLSTLLLRSVWRDYTVIDLILTTLPLIAPRERKGFILTILTSLREGRAEPGAAPHRTAYTLSADPE